MLALFGKRATDAPYRQAQSGEHLPNINGDTTSIQNIKKLKIKKHINGRVGPGRPVVVRGVVTRGFMRHTGENSRTSSRG